jgi:hypothetical protein
MASTQEVLRQIDAALELWATHRAKSKYEDLSDLKDRSLFTEVNTILAATLGRLAPVNSPYRDAMSQIMAHKVGALRALRRDYEAGHLATVQSLVRAEVFGDFLEMAEHLLQQGYKDPCAVLVGGVLENHLRSLCHSRGIDVHISGKPKKADSMNSDLASADAYSKLDQKNVTAWLDLRNKAAHGHYVEYNADQVQTLLFGVREFAARVAV